MQASFFAWYVDEMARTFPFPTCRHVCSHSCTCMCFVDWECTNKERCLSASWHNVFFSCPSSSFECVKPGLRLCLCSPCSLSLSLSLSYGVFNGGTLGDSHWDTQKFKTRQSHPQFKRSWSNPPKKSCSASGVRGPLFTVVTRSLHKALL